MSITVRLWSDDELMSIETGKDKWLATIFMNVKTFSKEGIKHYPYNLRRTYHCFWNEDGELDEEKATIYATDQRNLLKFLDAEYTKRPNAINQVITQYRPLTY